MFIQNKGKVIKPPGASSLLLPTASPRATPMVTYQVWEGTHQEQAEHPGPPQAGLHSLPQHHQGSWETEGGIQVQELNVSWLHPGGK